MTIRDPYGRVVNNIRISVTRRCNIHCFYCHKEGDYSTGELEMKPIEIARIVDIAAHLGIKKVKITGGEPLIREDVLEIFRLIKRTSGIEELSMTTNGILLTDMANRLKDAGLDRVNVSLDSINKTTFRKITGVNALKNVLQGIDKARDAQLTPIKINMVLLKGLNDSQVWQMIEFAQKNHLILQLIEFESPYENEMYRKYHADLSTIEVKLRKQAKKIITRKMHHRQRFLLPNEGEVEIVRPMHNTEFCNYCNRIRVTSDGMFKPCLLTSDTIDFLSPLRQGASNGDLEKILLQAIQRRKPYFK
ncbi:GTP 3',8-cyclase MoaA [[Eubacterium] cellulosolvens]